MPAETQALIIFNSLLRYLTLDSESAALQQTRDKMMEEITELCQKANAFSVALIGELHKLAR
jgi:hypothetical protein